MGFELKSFYFLWEISQWKNKNLENYYSKLPPTETCTPCTNDLKSCQFIANSLKNSTWTMGATSIAIPPKDAFTQNLFWFYPNINLLLAQLWFYRVRINISPIENFVFFKMVGKKKTHFISFLVAKIWKPRFYIKVQ